jgi:hypothetical protein
MHLEEEGVPKFLVNQKKLRGNCQTLTEHNAANYGAKMQEILSLVPQGGSINDLPKRLRPKSYLKCAQRNLQ